MTILKIILLALVIYVFTDVAITIIKVIKGNKNVRSDLNMKETRKPIKSIERDNTGEFYWMCPKCQHKVGGYVIYGSGENDWGYEKSKFCSECGQAIEWG